MPARAHAKDLVMQSVCGYAVLVIAAMLAACTGEPGRERYAMEPPPPAELLGVWTAREQSLRDLKRTTAFTIAESTRHRIDLHDSGVCTFRSHWQYSYVDAEDPEDASYFDTSNCTWRVGTAPARIDAIERDVPAVLLHVREGRRQAYPYFFLLRRNGALTLWQSIGEPDSGYFMEFVKQSAGAG